ADRRRHRTESLRPAYRGKAGRRGSNKTPRSALDAARGETLFDRGKAARRLEVIPLAFMDDAVKPLGENGAGPIRLDGEFAAWRASEEAAMQQLDRREIMRCDFGFAAPSQQADRIDHEIARSVEPDRGDGALHQQNSVHRRAVEGARDADQRRHLAVEPEHIGVDDIKGLAEM